MQKILIILCLTLLVMGWFGCVTKDEIYSYDKEGNMVKKELRERSSGDRLSETLDEGSWMIVNSGWAGYISVSMATIEDPTPTFKIFVGNKAFTVNKIDNKQTDAEKVSEHQKEVLIKVHGRTIEANSKGLSSNTHNTKTSE